MPRILFIASSPRGADSLSTKVGQALVERLAAAAGAAVIRRDLDAEKLPHLDVALIRAQATAPEARSAEQRAALALSDTLVGELMAADVVVIASAMINFAVTSTLKAWIDYVTRAGVTFRYSDDGKPEGLLTAKKVYLVEARGGVYSQGPQKAADFQEPYLRHMLGFLGMTDIEAIPVEGIAFGPEAAEKSVAAALAWVAAIPVSAAA
jgi:FMN-dependent NADH-azoreductase